MNVLFVVSGKKDGVSPITLNQANSILALNKKCNISYFIIKKKGISGYLRNYLPLLIEIRKKKPDIIHAHYSYCGFLTALTLTNKKIIVSLMGSDATKKGFGLFIVNFFSRFLWDRVIVKSDAMKNHFENKKMIILPNGVNFDVFKTISKVDCQAEIGFNKAKKHIVFFLTNPDRKEKNLPLAEEAISLLDDKDNVDFHIINYVDKEKVPIILNASDMLLLTSFHEGSPNIVKEAMACSIPIVTTDVGDVRKIIGNTEGCYITTFDPMVVKNSIEKALIYNKRTNGRENIQFLSSSLIASKLFRIYSDLKPNE